MPKIMFVSKELKKSGMKLSQGDIIKHAILAAGTEYHGDDVIVITPEDLAQAVSNFNAGAYGEADMPLNFVHNDDSAAAAWIQKIELSEDKNQLIATFKVTEKGAKELNGGNFRYPSIEANRNGYTRHDGVEFKGLVVTGCALLNRPQQKQLESMSQFKEKKAKNKSSIKFNAEDVLNEIETFLPGELISILEKAIAILPDEMSDEERERLMALGLNLNTDEEDINMKDHDDENESVEMKEMRKQISKLENENDDSKKTLLFTALRQTGHALPAQRENFMKLSFKEATKFAEIAKQGTAIDFAEIGHSFDIENDVTNDEQTNVLLFAEKVKALTNKDKIDYREAAKRVAKEQPKLAKAAGFNFN